MALFRKERRHAGLPSARQSPVSFSLVGALQTGLLLPFTLFVSYVHTLRKSIEPFLPRFYKTYSVAQRRRYKDIYRFAFANRERPTLIVARKAVQYFNRISKTEARLSAVIFFGVLIIAVPLFVFLLPSYLAPLVQVIVSPDEYPLSKASGTSTFTLAFLGSLASVILSHGEERKSLLFCTIVFVAFLVLAIYSEYDPSIGIVRFANTVAIGVVMYLLYFASYLTVIAMIAQLSRVFKERYVARAHPDAATFLAVMRVAADCNKGERDWNNLDFRAKIIGQLDRAANIIDNNLAKQLASLASDSSNEVKEQWHQIASGIRSKVRWITTPQDSTRRDLIVRLQDFLINFALGRWHALIENEKLETTALRRASRVKRIVSAGRSCLLAVTPIALILGCQRFVAPLDPLVGSYATFFSLLWLLVYAIPSMDPQWKERLANMKDLVSSMKDAKDLLKSGDAKPPA